MEIRQLSTGAVAYGADDKYDLVAEDKVKINIKGDKVFGETVPEGKKWTVRISVRIEEENE